MRNNQSLLILILFSVFFIQCKKDPGSNSITDPVIETPLPITATLQGNVYNENNVPSAGVTVKAGSKSAITDAKGYFRIVNAALDKRSSVVTAVMNG